MPLTRKMTTLNEELVQAITKQFAEQFTAFKKEAKLDTLTERLAKLDDTLDTLDEKISSAFDEHFETFKKKQEKSLDTLLEKKFNEHLGTIDKVIETMVVNKVSEVTTNFDTSIKAIEGQVMANKTRIDSVNSLLVKEIKPLKELTTQWDEFAGEIEERVNKLSQLPEDLTNQLVSSVSENFAVKHKTDIDLLKQQMQELQAKQLGNTGSMLGAKNLVRHFPKFKQDGKTHPVVFLKSFDDLPDELSDKDKINFVTGFMEDDARDWGITHTSEFTSWEDFENKFKDRFWSRSAQDKLRKTLWNPPFYRKDKGTMKDFVNKFVTMARYLDDPFEEKQLLGILVTRLPVKHQKEIFLKGWTSLSDLLSTLETLDMFVKEVDDKSAKTAQRVASSNIDASTTDVNQAQTNNGHNNNWNKSRNGYEKSKRFKGYNNQHDKQFIDATQGNQNRSYDDMG